MTASGQEGNCDGNTECARLNSGTLECAPRLLSITHTHDLLTFADIRAVKAFNEISPNLWREDNA